MSSNSIKNELADHIYQYLCHEAQYSDLPEAARESLTAASECIEQAYKLNSNHQNTNTPNNPNNANSNSTQNRENVAQIGATKSSDILPDELLRIFTRHKEFLLAQQIDSLKTNPLRNDGECPSTSMDKPDIRLNSNPLAGSNLNDSHPNNNNTNSSNPYNTTTPSTTTNNAPQPSSSKTNKLALSDTNAQQQAATSSKHHSQHPISQLPMTTRKKLSHLRAQIKRQASKAARSRLEKRSSVSGVGSSGSSDRGASLGLGASMDATCTSSKHQAGDGSKGHQHRELHNQPNSSSSTESPSNQVNPSPNVGGSSGSNNQNVTGGHDNNNPNLSPSQNVESSSSKNSGGHLSAPGAGQHRHSSSKDQFGVSVHQKNFKQRLIALLKKFRTDGSDFDSEEQYREALERELMKAAAGRGSRAIEELLEEDIDVEEESGSELEDWDNISETSTPKPSLRPFFSSTTLDKI